MIFKTVDSTPRKKFSPGKVLLGLLALDFLIIIGLVVVAYLPQYYRTKDKILQMTFNFNIILIILVLLCAVYYVFFRTRSKRFTGNLEIRENEIVINEVNYPLSDIKHLRFVGNDIRGEFRGFASKGIDNQIFIDLKNTGKTAAYFEQSTEANLKQARPILEHYKAAGILTEANFDTIMKNTNYY